MRWNAELEKLGRLRVFRAKLSPILNALNVYTLITKRRDTDVTLKNKALRTTTPAGAGSQFKRMWEQVHAERRAHDAKVSAHMRGVYDGTGAWWLKAAYDRTRQFMGASVGTYTGPTMTDEQIAVARARVEQAKKESIEREKIAEQARKRALLERAAEYKRQQAEMVINPGWMKA
jgi:hypothetical protein